MSDLLSDLGPLPEGDRQDTLQQLSLKAIQNALPVSEFLFRDERIDDKGVDGTLEVKSEFTTENKKGEVRSRFTNFRSQVQLKSTDSPRLLQDGTISLPIDTSNLNYLLNGNRPCISCGYPRRMSFGSPGRATNGSD